ncbi:STAS domain-containing protein [Streptacidiphilus neutrinimicus]|uniref:STAS domain-containing protein n=1 Tax=Streptacidiphilus neutrinimicus TaxID=105420 RepID=UPI000AEE0BE3|nr:STAS domain-containing protein [Streptacidiphilus neutrinimicus]
MSAESVVTRRLMVSHSLPQPRAGAATLAVERHDRGSSAEITLIGDIDLDSVSLVRRALTRCLLDGARTIDVELTHVGFCDCSGLSAFLDAYHRAAAIGASVRLHHPAPPVARLLALTDTESLLLAPQPARPA